MRSTMLVFLLVALPAHASEPCGPRIGRFELIAPQPFEEGVPRNLSVSARTNRGVIGQGGSAEEVPDGTFVFIDTVTSSTLTARTLVSAGRTGSYLEIRPLQILEPKRRYELRSTDPQLAVLTTNPSRVLAFTTGEDEDHEPPAAPSVVRAEGIDFSADGCDTPGIELEIEPHAAGGARALFGSQRNTLPFNPHFAAALGAGGAPIAQLIVGEEAQVDGEVVAIDLAGNRSAAAAFSTNAGGGCTCAGAPRGGAGGAVLMVLALLLWRATPPEFRRPAQRVGSQGRSE